MVYIAAFNISSNASNKVHAWWRAQIAHLKIDEATVKFFSKYTDFIDIFSPKLTLELSKQMGINDHTIDLVDNWELLYNFIYSLGPMKLKRLKAYIENNLAIDFIRSSKSLAGAPI